MSGGLSQCAHVDILEGYPNHEFMVGILFLLKRSFARCCLKHNPGRTKYYIGVYSAFNLAFLGLLLAFTMLTR